MVNASVMNHFNSLLGVRLCAHCACYDVCILCICPWKLVNTQVALFVIKCSILCIHTAILGRQTVERVRNVIKWDHKQMPSSAGSPSKSTKRSKLSPEARKKDSLIRRYPTGVQFTEDAASTQHCASESKTTGFRSQRCHYCQAYPR